MTWSNAISQGGPYLAWLVAEHPGQEAPLLATQREGSLARAQLSPLGEVQTSIAEGGGGNSEARSECS